MICENFEIEQPGIASYCSKGRLDSLVKIILNEERCYVLVEKKFPEPATGPSFSGSAVAGAGSPSTNGSTAGLAAGFGGSYVSAFRSSLSGVRYTKRTQGFVEDWRFSVRTSLSVFVFKTSGRFFFTFSSVIQRQCKA